MEIIQFITRALKSILKLVKLQSLVFDAAALRFSENNQQWVTTYSYFSRDSPFQDQVQEQKHILYYLQ